MIIPSENLEALSKLLKLVAANEGVLEGKSSEVMNSLVRAIQRTIDANEKEKKGKNELANLIVRDCVEHIQGANIPTDDEMEVRESLHPCWPGSNYEGEAIHFEGARAMRISFQRNLCDLGEFLKFLSFFLFFLLCFFFFFLATICTCTPIKYLRTWQILTIIVTFFFSIHGLVSSLFYFLFFFSLLFLPTRQRRSNKNNKINIF